jgi:hypothetical protein
MHEVILAPAPPHAAAPVELYLAGQPVPRSFTEVALLQAVGHGADANLESTMNAIARRAAALGCDAVVNAHFDGGTAMAHAFGACVVWLAK